MADKANEFIKTTYRKKQTTKQKSRLPDVKGWYMNYCCQIVTTRSENEQTIAAK